MKIGWETKTIGEIASIEYGYTDKTLNEADYRYVRITDIDKNGELTIGDKKYVKHTKESANFVLSDGDLLMARTGATFAKVLLYTDNEPSIFASYLIRIKFKEKILNKFYWYFSKSQEYWRQAIDLSSGSAQPHFNGAALKRVIFKYPNTLQEQQQIVALLDEAFEAIDQAKANIEKNIQNAKELFQSKLNAIFSQKGEGWEEKSFQDLSTRIGDGLHGTPKYDDNGEYFFINGNNLTNGRIEIKEGTKRINKEEYLLHKRELNANTVLVSINGTLGNVAFYNNEPVILGKSACYINFNPEVYKHYVKYLIKSPLFFKNMSDESTGATIKNFSLKSMRNYKFHIPPKNLQIEIVKNLEKIEDEIDSLICSLEKKAMNLDELKKSILQKAFAGELTNKTVTA